MKRALVRDSDGLVVNVIVAGEGYRPPDDHSLVDPEAARVSPGDTWNGARFTPKPAPAPVPDVPGFRLAVFGALGKERTRQLLALYGDIPIALEANAFDLALDAFKDALDAGDATRKEYDAVQALWDAFHLPRPEGGVG